MTLQTRGYLHAPLGAHTGLTPLSGQQRKYLGDDMGSEKGSFRSITATNECPGTWRDTFHCTHDRIIGGLHPPWTL